MSRTAAVRTTVPRTPAPRGTGARTGAREVSARTAAARVTGARSPRSATRPELRLVPTVGATRPRRRAGSALLSRKATYVLLLVAMLSLTTVGLLVLNTAIAVDSLQASKAREANASRAQEVQRLERAVVAGETPGEVARAAAAAGLVPAGVAGYLVIGPEATAMRGTPEPAPAPEPAPSQGPSTGTPGGN